MKPVRKGLSRLTIICCIALVASLGAIESVHGQSPPRQLSMMVAAEDIVSISRSKEIPRKEFDNDYWGQFQVLIPKEHFPIAAPNCKKNVILRMPAVAPDDPSRSARLDARWELFQALHEIKEGLRKGPVEVGIASGPYMKTKKDGTRVLEYCNAFIKLQ